MTSEKEDFESELTSEVLRKITKNDDLHLVDSIEFSIDSDLTSINDLGTLLPNLVELKLTSPSYLPSLRKLGSCLNLRVLSASAVGLDSLDGASGVPNLKELFISYNQITDLSPIAFLPDLEILDLEHNLIDSGLELRFLSLCSNLGHVTMLGCPLSDLPDYIKIVKKRLPESCILDNEDESDDENENRAMQEKLLNLEDANFIKELVADGLLDEDELLAEEPLSRPFTAIGIRPKTGQLTPTSAGATRPRTALQSFARERTSISIARDVTPPQTEYSSQLTAGAVLQGNRGLIARQRSASRDRPRSALDRPKSAGSLPQKTPENLRKEIEEKLNNWKPNNEQNHQVDILKIDHEEPQYQTPVPETRVRVRSTRTIRSDPKKDEKIVEENEEREIPGPSVSEEILTKDTFSKNPRQTAQSEPVSPAPYLTSNVSKTSVPGPVRPAGSLTTSMRDMLKLKDIQRTAKKELSARSFRSRQEALLAEGKIIKEVVSSAPIIKHQSPSRKSKSINI